MKRALLLVAILGVGVFVYRDRIVLQFCRLAWARDPGCSLGDTWRAVRANERLWARIDEIADGMVEVQTDPAGYELIEAGQRRFWILPGNGPDVAEMLAEQEADVYGTRQGVRKGDVVLDCGANAGVFTRRALEAGARLVVAIELTPGNIECLKRTFAGEIQAGRVIVYPKGVWDKDDELELRTYDYSGGNSVALQFPGSRRGPRVPLTTIDKLVVELRLERVDFIKMDIEGAERKALNGAKQTVSRFRPRMAISMEHLPDDAQAIPALVKGLWPSAAAACGRCTWIRTALVERVSPEELYVTP